MAFVRPSLVRGNQSYFVSSLHKPVAIAVHRGFASFTL